MVLWRHGQTAWNLEGRVQGSTDVPLDDVGQSQATRAANLLSGLRPAAIVSSDLSRAWSTAEPLAAITGLALRADPRLRERFQGEWEGLSDTDLRERYPRELARWDPPGAETYQAVAARVVPAVREAAEAVESGVLVVVSHGGAIRAGIAVLLGLPARARILGPLANCCWSVLGADEAGWRLLEHNAGTLPEPVLGEDR